MQDTSVECRRGSIEQIIWAVCYLDSMETLIDTQGVEYKKSTTVMMFEYKMPLAGVV